jgi:hypothetical protein
LPFLFITALVLDHECWGIILQTCSSRSFWRNSSPHLYSQVVASLYFFHRS